MNKSTRIFAILAVFIGVVLFAVSGMLFERSKAEEVLVIQAPITGKLNFYFEAGLYWQGFGSATKYKKESPYWFSSHEDQGGTADQSIAIRFNDGGRARISGSVRWKLPSDEKNMRKIHTNFGNQIAVEQELVRTVIEKSVYMTGPLLSSKESYAEKRNSLISYIEDQASRGVYQTRTKEVKGADPLSGKEKTFSVTEVIVDTTKGSYARQDKSPLEEYGIRIYNLSLNKIKYDQQVEDQITQQQHAIMDVQTAIASAKKAEQNAIKAEKEGEAAAAEAKWKQEVIKARLVTEAEQKREVSKLNMEAAEYYKKEQILIGEGDAARKKLAMQADGALEKKIEAYISVNKMYAEAIKGYKGNWVPSVVMGGDNGGTTNSSQNLINLLMAKTAKELSLDLSLPKGGNQ